MERDAGEAGVVAVDERGLWIIAAPSETTAPPLLLLLPPAPNPAMVAGGVEKVDGSLEGELSLDCECASVS